MKKIYLAFFISAIFFSELSEAQHVQWMNSTPINYSMNPALPQQPISVSANKIFAARMTSFAFNFGVDNFGSAAIECYDISGWLMWSFPIGDSIVIKTITSDPGGNVIVGGEYMGTMNLGSTDSMANTSVALFNINLFLFSLDGAGNLTWKRNVTLSHPDAWEVSDLEIDNHGSCWYGLSYFDSVSIKKLDGNGNEVQSYLIEGTRSMNSFSFDPMGNLYAAGSSGSLTMTIGNTSANVPEPYMMFVTRIDAAGNCNWIKLAHDVTFQSPCIVATANGDAYLAGNLMDSTNFGNVTFHHPQWVYDIFLTKLDSTGNFFWGVQILPQQTITGDFYRGKNNFIDVDASGNVYMTGTLRGLVDWGNGIVSDVGQTTSTGMAIVSFDNAGLARWQLTGSSIGDITPYSIVVTGVDECFFGTGLVGEMTMDSVSTNQGNNFAFVVGNISASTGINNQDLSNNFVLYPNPANDKLSFGPLIPKGGTQAVSEISIYNSLGKKVNSDKPVSSAMNQLEINVSKLPDGIYFLSVGDLNKKFVIRHR